MRAGRLAALMAVGLGLVACAPGTPAPPTEPDELPRRVWLPEVPPRAAILAVHGFNDYSNAFTDFGTFAAEQGVAVHAYDQRGFGANPDPGQWPGSATLVEDLVRERQRLGTLYPDVPVYLLGESMGAAVIIAAAAQDAPLEDDGIILSAPAVWGGDQLSRFYRATLWVMVHVAPGLELTGSGLKIMASDNIEMLRGLGADPLFIKGTRVDAIAGLVELMDIAALSVDRLDGPLLVLGGARDQVVPPGAHQAMLRRLSAQPCTEVVYDDGYHMLLRDLQRQVVWSDILAWIDERTIPSGGAGSCPEGVLPDEIETASDGVVKPPFGKEPL
jgi:alpha-beta hydrolase superfamily lysophospholipase